MRNEYKKMLDKAVMPTETENRIYARLDEIDVVKHNKPRKRTLSVAILAAITAAVLLSVSAVAYVCFGGAALLDRDTELLLNEPSIKAEAVNTSASVSDAPAAKPSDGLITDEFAEKLNASSITRIATRADGSFPEIISENGAMVILTNENGGGLQLDKGGTATLSLALNLDISSTEYWSNNSAGERVEIGFIHGGKTVEILSDKQQSFTATFSADEDGEYYFYYINYSASYIVAEGGLCEVTD